MAIRVDVNVYTPIQVDLADFDFTGVSKLIMTFKNVDSETNYPDERVLFTKEFTSPGVYIVDITPIESMLLEDGCVYDFTVVTTDGRGYKNGGNEKITLRRGVGEMTNGNR